MSTINKTAFYLILSALAILPFHSFSIDHVTMSIQNATTTANTIEFDVFIVNDGTTAIKLRGYSFGINFNLAILNGATPTSTSYIYMTGTRDTAFNAFAATSSAYNNFQLKNVVTFSSIANAVNLPIGLQMRLGRFQFTNAVNWASGSVPNFQFQLTQAVGKTQCIAAVYSDITLTTSNLSNPISATNPVSTLNAISNIAGLTLNIPLPVNLLSFTGLKSGKEHLLNWTTSQEEHNNYFNLQHSIDGIHFNTIEKIYSHAEGGNSSTPLHYASKHSQPVYGHNYYRLEQVDIDGHAAIEGQMIDLIQYANGNQILIYPNPATDIVHINFESDRVKNILLKVIDMTGRTVKTISSISANGSNKVSINVDDIRTGNYFIQMFENNILVLNDKIKVGQ